jgi:hypothetical protein
LIKRIAGAIGGCGSGIPVPQRTLRGEGIGHVVLRLAAQVSHGEIAFGLANKLYSAVVNVAAFQSGADWKKSPYRLANYPG